ncbi:hypothetical protein LIER_14148 [Lithospermum erythrorhizon]|uniref:Uncharacterized protein n=1 Tax=Lithospermum erythrorhizon TaxID=34254 RepID=A0AAV3PY06_LITER
MAHSCDPGHGCNSDAELYSTPQVSSSLAALARNDSSVPLRATPLATRAPSSQPQVLVPLSSRRPLQSKVVKANIDCCGSELSENDLVELRSRYGIPSSVIMRLPKATERANAPHPRLRSIFIMALENGLRLPVQPYVGDMMSMAAGVTPTEEFFVTSFSQCTQKDDFFLLCGETGDEEFLQSIPLQSGIRDLDALLLLCLRSTKHMAGSIAFSTYWENKCPMPLHFYSDQRVLKAAGLSIGSDVDLGALEALRATFNVHDHAPLPPPTAPATSFDQLPLSPYRFKPVLVSSSSEEDEVGSPLMRGYVPFPGLSSFVDPFCRLYPQMGCAF